MKPKIVILDDENNIMEDLCTLFNAAGFDAVGFTDVASAYSWLENHDVDIVCTDSVLRAPADYPAEETDYGKKTGIAFVRRAKRLKPETHFIAFTVIREKDIIQEMKDAGIEAIILKPAVFNDILQAVEKSLRKDK